MFTCNGCGESFATSKTEVRDDVTFTPLRIEVTQHGLASSKGVSFCSWTCATAFVQAKAEASSR